MPGESKSSPRRIEMRLRQSQALRLRMGGSSFDDIARQLGYKQKSGAYHAVAAALRDIPKHDAEEYRTLNLERLNRILMALWPDVINSTAPLADRQKAAAECRAIIAEISKLMGSYAPDRVDVLIRVRELARELGYTDEETRQVVEAAQQIVRGET